jgi:hypothetical protein
LILAIHFKPNQHATLRFSDVWLQVIAIAALQDFLVNISCCPLLPQIHSPNTKPSTDPTHHPTKIF